MATRHVDGRLTLEVDSRDAQDMVDKLADVLDEDEFNKALYRICAKTGNQVKKILKRRLPEDYITKPNWISAAVHAPRMGGGPGINCVIPLIGTRATVGGHIVKATGGVHGWQSLQYKGNPYPVTGTIVKGGVSRLPGTMPHQGGFPPFRNTKSPKKNGIVFTRKTKAQYPIASVSALAVPQMPFNQSREAVEQDIHDALLEQTEKYLGYIFK